MISLKLSPAPPQAVRENSRIAASKIAPIRIRVVCKINPSFLSNKVVVIYIIIKRCIDCKSKNWKPPSKIDDCNLIDAVVYFSTKTGVFNLQIVITKENYTICLLKMRLILKTISKGLYGRIS